MGCSPENDYWSVNRPVSPAGPMTPREREFHGRIKELEKIVSKVAKTIFYDDSLTEAMPTFVGENAVSAEKHQSVVQANEDLRLEVQAKDQEIVRLSELATRLDNENYILKGRLTGVRDVLDLD